MFLSLFGTIFGLFPQSVNNIQFPPSLGWKQIETERCILIFPENLEAKASEIAGMIDSFYPVDEASLETETSKWPVIINNTLFYSNAYVLGAPRHSQLYTTPIQDNSFGTGDWLPLIWSHELRHIVQNEKMIRGFTALANWIAGEYGSSGMSHFALPNWVMEGDAVLTETLVSTGGRGRLADFERELRTNSLNGIRYSYFKSSQGSYASYSPRTPNWYVTGYHLCTYIRREFGIDAFNRILEIAADFSFTPLILNIAVRKVTGENIETLYNNCLDELTELWETQLEQREFTGIDIITSGKEDDADYYPLGKFKNGNIAALRTSLSAFYTLVEISDNGTVTELRKINPFDKNISFNGTTFCWAETKKDIRWGNRSWSNIRIYTPSSGDYRIITDKTRYLSPSISPDGSKIAAVEITEELNSYIVVIDAETGKLVSRFAEPSGASPMQTCWTDDGTGIVYIRQQNWMKSLRLLEPETKINRPLTSPDIWSISSPDVKDNVVYFISEETGLENIHALQLQEGNRLPENRLIVSRPYGTASPAAEDGTLYFADYTVSGFKVSAVPLPATATSPVIPAESGHVDYFEILADQEPFFGFAGAETHSKTAEYAISDYYPFTGLFNFHSRSLATTLSGTGIAASLQADSIMNDSSGRIYFGYDPDETELVAGMTGAYAGFFPVLLYGAELQSPAAMPGTMFESFVYGGLWLPLDFSGGILNHTLSLQGLFLMENQLYPAESAATALEADINWKLTQVRARRDLVPPLGITLKGSWYYSLEPSYYNFVFGECRVYIPGLLDNQGFSFKLQGNYNIGSGMLNKSPETVPRGLTEDNYAVPLLFNSSFEYILPLAYPDFAVGSIFYIPRLYMNCFLDTALIPDSQILQTAGVELFTDFHLFNHYYPFSAGIRLIYNTVERKMRLEDTAFSIGIDLF